MLATAAAVNRWNRQDRRTLDRYTQPASHTTGQTTMTDKEVAVVTTATATASTTSTTITTTTTSVLQPLYGPYV